MRQKKRKLTNHNLLHSDKSTYFYKGTLGKLFLRVQLFCHKGLYPGWRGSKSRPKRSEGFDFESATKARWQNSGRIQKTVIALSTFALLGLAYFFANPFTNSVDNVSAASPDPNFSITLSLGDAIKTEETLDTGVVGYIENNFTISSTATESYSIYLRPADGYSNNLIGRANTDITIPGVGDNVSVANFTNNTWGYGLSETNSTSTANSNLKYSTIPDGKTPIKTVSNPDDGNDTYKLVFAARIGDDKPADHYESQALLSVAASPKAVAVTWDTIQYMQEMTSEICANVDTPTTSATSVPTKQLIDKRDDKTYYVSKLADGNCWMTQNLALDLASYSKAKQLTPDDSDITNNWPTTTLTSTWSSNASDIGWKISDTGVDTGDGVGKGHSSYGGYYTWVAATAGTANSAELTASDANGKDAPDSICPKGWRLPFDTNSTSTTIASDKKATWKKLLDKYNITSWNTLSPSLNKAPIYIVQPGYVVTNGSVSIAGYGGHYWSATAYSSTGAYDLGFNSNNVNFNTSYYDNRYYGYSVRCVAR